MSVLSASSGPFPPCPILAPRQPPRHVQPPRPICAQREPAQPAGPVVHAKERPQVRAEPEEFCLAGRAIFCDSLGLPVKVSGKARPRRLADSPRARPPATRTRTRTRTQGTAPLRAPGTPRHTQVAQQQQQQHSSVTSRPTKPNAASHCPALPCAALRCAALHCTALHCTTYTTLRRTAAAGCSA